MATEIVPVSTAERALSQQLATSNFQASFCNRELVRILSPNHDRKIVSLRESLGTFEVNSIPTSAGAEAK